MPSRTYERESRSRDRHQYRGRSSSSDSYERRKKDEHKKKHHLKSKRVKFTQAMDIKVFKKEDEPSCKGLTDVELQQYMIKLQKEKGMSIYQMNWENMKHRDAQLENISIKQQKEREKALGEKLMSIREQIDYGLPPNIKHNHYNDIEMGKGSTQRQNLSIRLNDVLACFYLNVTQIPAQPNFQILNKSTPSQPQNIRFDKQNIDNSTLPEYSKPEKPSKPLKGILKVTLSEHKPIKGPSQPRDIDPNLFKLLRQINANKNNYSRQKTQLLLKPYKQSGQLDYLNKNQHLFENFLRHSAPISQPEPPKTISNPIHTYQPQIINQKNIPPFRPSPPPQTNPNVISYPQQQMHQNSQIPPNFMPPQPQGMMNSPISQPPPAMTPSNMNPMNYHPSMMMNRNYKTVPCKYFHRYLILDGSPQGCVKGHNCTFIHDEQYAGRPTPEMLKYNRGMNIVQYEGQSMMNQGMNQGMMNPGMSQGMPQGMNQSMMNQGMMNQGMPQGFHPNQPPYPSK